MNTQIFCFGDSVTQGFWDERGGWADRLRQAELAKGLRRQSSYASVFNLGISGENSRGVVRRLVNEIEARRWPNNQVIIIVAIGLNDSCIDHGEEQVPLAEYRQNLQQIMRLARDYTSRILLVESTPVDEVRTQPVAWGDYHYSNQRVQQYNHVMHEVAQAGGVSVVPVYRAFTEVGVADLLHDGLHPNSAGHELLHQIIHRASRELQEGAA